MLKWLKSRKALIAQYDALVTKINEYEHMVRNIRAILSVPENSDVVNYVYQIRDILVNNASQALIAKILNQKDFSNTPDLAKMTPPEYRAYIAEASTIYHSQVIRDLLTEFTNEQVKYQILHGDGSRDVLFFTRGTINGLSLIEDKLKQLDAEHQAAIAEDSKDSKPQDVSQLIDPIE